MVKIKIPALPIPTFLKHELVQRGLRYGVFFGVGIALLAFAIPYFPDQIRFFDFTETKRILLLAIMGFVAATLRGVHQLGVSTVCDGWCLPTTLGGVVIAVAAFATECIAVGFLAAFVRHVFLDFVKSKTK